MIVVLSGTSGVGKSVVLETVRKKRNDLRFSISSTTRAPRPEETNMDYHFVTEDAFLKNMDNYIEFVCENGVYYATERTEVLPRYPGEIVVLDVDCAGGLAVKQAFPHDTVVLIFITAPKEVVEQRLRGRETGGRMDEATIQARLARYDTEYAKAAASYDYIVENTGSIEECASHIIDIIDSYV